MLFQTISHLIRQRLYAQKMEKRPKLSTNAHRRKVTLPNQEQVIEMVGNHEDWESDAKVIFPFFIYLDMNQILLYN